VVETVPSSPPVAPTRNNLLTSISSITVDYLEVTGYATGGATILSYELQWDQGPNVATWVTLVGFDSDSLATQFTVPTTLVGGTVYNFRYRAKNRQGWGDVSSTTGIMAAAVPGQLSPVATEMNGVNVKISWTIADQPSYSDGGQPVTGYQVEI
jgi:hypothetical protein